MKKHFLIGMGVAFIIISTALLFLSFLQPIGPNYGYTYASTVTATLAVILIALA